MASNFQHIQPGTNVYDSDGDKVGDVSEVGASYLLVRQGWLFKTDTYVPLSAVAGIDEDGIRLSVDKDHIEGLGWDVMPTEEQTAAAFSGSSSLVADADTSGMQTGTRGVAAEGEVAIPVVEEELLVGKRAVETGGVQVTTRVEEVPVNEQVTLRDEQVRVERRAVDQPVDAATVADAFQEGSFEVRETDEQAVVQKEARVVEEVVIGKEVQQRTETIQDTVRRTDVDVQEIPGQTRTTGYTDVSGTTGTTGTTGMSGTGDEGAIERGLSQAGNAAEGATGLDLDRDGDTGRRDPRNNY